MIKFGLVTEPKEYPERMLKKIISYLYPITKKIESQHNGILELTVLNGRKLLDTKNVNYSYGSLQRVLNFSLDQLDLKSTKNSLILGLGGGSVVHTLRDERKFEGEITAVEIDPVIIDIASNEFDVSANNQTHIVCDDAWNFVKNDTSKYDLIIVDLFIDDKIPEKFLAINFWKNILDLLNEGGDVIFNTLCNPKTDLTFLKEKLERRNFLYEVHRYVEKSNKVLIAHAKRSA